MNENITALLRINHAQLTDFRTVMPRYLKQSAISHLSAHLGVKGRSIEDDVELSRFSAGQNRLDNRFGLQKIVAEKLRWLCFQVFLRDADFFLFLRLAGAMALFF